MLSLQNNKGKLSDADKNTLEFLQKILIKFLLIGLDSGGWIW